MTKLNAIEEIMAEAMAASRRRVVPGGPPPTPSPMSKIQVDGYIHAARECLAALDAAGLAVVSKDIAAMDEWIQKWTFPGGIYEDAPPPPKTGPWPGKPKT